ncbi:nitrilase-related carbon-nitrogen hydrolase, partial [Sneathia sanguinegens]|uniref:nitrilase-related carbon-nitrogen hydrolase n=1 Tax=Sneathia sanguinegens TaxID=40543 RepID=UPI0023F66531
MKNPKVAIIQAEPILFDKEATLNKAISLIEKASQKQVDLIVFPELFIPGYP